MGRLSTEEKHKRQLEKMRKNGIEEPKNTYVAPPSEKELLLAKLEKKYSYQMIDNVAMFLTLSATEREEIKKQIKNRFSYGFFEEGNKNLTKMEEQEYE